MVCCFRHYKGKYYQLLGEALDTTDDSIVVLYRTLYPSEHLLYVRPKEEFYGTVPAAGGQSVQRFTPVSGEELPEEAQNMLITSLPVHVEEKV